MDAETNELADTAETLERFATLAEGFHPDHPLAQNAVLMKLTLRIAVTHLRSYVEQRLAGADREDALLTALKGDVWSPEVQTAFRSAIRSGLQ